MDYPERLVAFIDILGFTDLVGGDERTAMATIDLLDDHLRHVKNVLQEPPEELSVKLFSDCMCISCASERTGEMLYNLAWLQLELAVEGIFLRGGLASGKHFENDNMIFSAGLVRVYQLEQQAVYPRIVVAEEIARRIEGYIFTIGAGDVAAQSFIMEAPDGLKFIDYLEFMVEEGFEEDYFLGRHKAAILEQVDRHKGQPRILDKYLWLAHYHNSKFTRFLEPADDWEEGYFKELSRKAKVDVITELPSFQNQSDSSSCDGQQH